jgi:hypothetical protein
MDSVEKEKEETSYRIIEWTISDLTSKKDATSRLEICNVSNSSCLLMSVISNSTFFCISSSCLQTGGQTWQHGAV